MKEAFEKLKQLSKAGVLLGMLSFMPLKSEGQATTPERMPIPLDQKIDQAAQVSRNINGILHHLGKTTFQFVDPQTHAVVTFSVSHADSLHLQEVLTRSTDQSSIQFHTVAGSGMPYLTTVVSGKNTEHPNRFDVRINTTYHKMTSTAQEKYSEADSKRVIEGYENRFLKECEMVLQALKDSAHVTDDQTVQYASAIEDQMVDPAHRHEVAPFVAPTLQDAVAKMVHEMGGEHHEIDVDMIAADGTRVKIRYATGNNPMLMVAEMVPGGEGSLAYEFDPKTYELISFANLNTGGATEGVQVFPTANLVSGPNMLDISSKEVVDKNVPETEAVRKRVKLLIEKIVTKIMNQ